MESPIKMDDLGVPLFLETPIFIDDIEGLKSFLLEGLLILRVKFVEFQKSMALLNPFGTYIKSGHTSVFGTMRCNFWKTY